MLARYNEAFGDNQQYVNISRVIVPSQQDKQQLLEALRYISELPNIDKSILAVNTLCQLANHPALIQVNKV